MGATLSGLLPTAYSTDKEVTLLDRKLGMLHVTISLLVFAYVIGYRVVLEEGYMAIEKPDGVVGLELNGTTYMLQAGIVVPQDVPSLVMTQSGPEGSSLFLPTRMLVSHTQRRSNCTTPDEPCTEDSDCVRQAPIAIGFCPAGSCIRQQWCNPGTDGLYATGQAADPFAGAALSTRELVLQDVGRLSITLTASLDFTQIGAVRLSTDSVESAARVRWTMEQVVQRAGMTIEDAQSLGALLDVGLSWDCPMLSTECVPVLKVQQLAAGLPFYTQWASYYRQDTSEYEYRDLYQARGIRLLVSSYGIGTAIGIEEIGIQLFVLLALLPVRKPRLSAHALHRSPCAPPPQACACSVTRCTCACARVWHPTHAPGPAGADASSPPSPPLRLRRRSPQVSQTPSCSTSSPRGAITGSTRQSSRPTSVTCAPRSSS